MIRVRRYAGGKRPLIVVASDRIRVFGTIDCRSVGKLPGPGDDRVSIQCYNGPPDAEHWIRFDDFRVVELAE